MILGTLDTTGVPPSCNKNSMLLLKLFALWLILLWPISLCVKSLNVLSVSNLSAVMCQSHQWVY
jgi:hypothetical protein